MNKTNHYKKIFYFCTLIILSANSHATIWVGDGANCDYSTIQQGLDQLALGTDNLLRIANKSNGQPYFENLNFDYNLPNDVTIAGGVDQCQGSQTQTPTEINGSGTGPVLNVSGGNVNQAITFSVTLLSFKDGTNDNSDRAGGINLDSVKTNFFLTSSSINNNRGIKGGGLYADLKNDSNLYIDDTNIFNNIGANGGGLYCEGGENFAYVRATSSIAYNRAESGNAGDGNGGGIYATNNCPLFISSGNDLFSSIEGIVSNQAANHGGGIYANNQAYVGLLRRTSFTGDVEFATLKDNIADFDNNGVGDGGAVYLKGTGTSLRGREAILENNAAVNGGAIATDENARAIFSNTLNNCSFDGHCFKFDRNIAGADVAQLGEGFGGAVYAVDESYISINRTLFTENGADNAVIVGVDAGAEVIIASSTIHSNGGVPDSASPQNFLFTALNPNTNLELNQVTLADNVLSSSSAVFLAALGSRVRVDNSLIFDVVDVMETFNANGSNTQLVFDCVVTHEDDSLSAAIGNQFVSFASAMNFVDAAGGDYRIRTPSLAIDLCPQIGEVRTDFEGQDFGYDDPNSGNFFGTVDAGSDESYLSDTIFVDDFEG